MLSHQNRGHVGLILEHISDIFLRLKIEVKGKLGSNSIRQHIVNENIRIKLNYPPRRLITDNPESSTWEID